MHWRNYFEKRQSDWTMMANDSRFFASQEQNVYSFHRLRKYITLRIPEPFYESHELLRMVDTDISPYHIRT
jgi:hypothetical protein